MKGKILNNILPILFFVLLGAASYSNTFDVPFYLDDYYNITENHNIRLSSLSVDGLKKAFSGGPLKTRPVAYFTFAINYYFHQYNLYGYHLVNAIIHIFSGFLLYLFIKTTLQTPVLRSQSEKSLQIAIFAALVWFVHPVQTQSVTYVVQRMNSMAGMFYILAFWMYAKGRMSSAKKHASIWFTGCGVAWLLAMGTKEIAATLPFFLFLYEWYFFRDLQFSWMRKRLIYIVGLIVALICLAYFYLGPDPIEKLLLGYQARGFSLQERVLTQFRVIFFYLGLFFLPLTGRLSLEHNFTISRSLIEPSTTILSILGILLIFALAIRLAKTNRLISFCIIWFLGNLVIESSVLPLEILFEHRLYLPTMLIFLPLAQAFLNDRRWNKAGFGFLVCLVIVLGVMTHSRNQVWRDPVIFWNDSIRHSPDNARLYNNLGLALYRRGEVQNSIKEFEEALRISPTYALAHNNLGLSYRLQGNQNKAVLHFNKALQYDPKISEAHANLGAIYGQQGIFNKSYSHLQEAVRLNPASAVAHNNFGNILLLLGRFDEAIDNYNKALRLMPDYEEARYNLAIAKDRSGKIR
jgi:tetratricopeptide (TPR) repeat protein